MKDSGLRSVFAMKEERRFPRACIDTTFCLLAKSGAVKGKAKNISPVGVFVCADRRLHVGDRVHINVHLPRYHGPVFSRAEVVWTGPKQEPCRVTGVGLKWIDLSMLDLFRLDNFVRHSQES
ncbi:MAG: PilZ domain-containing protein [Deltaproteobacteria bacterium]|nr:MAG: PilZ domain-containing protein [Deltaproteobacteria bacterium]